MSVKSNFSEKISTLVTDLTKADKVNINNAIFASVFEVADVASTHQLRTEVRNGTLIPIINGGDYYGKMIGSDETSCALPEGELSHNYSTKKWDLGEYAVRIPLCMRNFDENFLVFWNMYRQRLDNPLEQPDTAAFLSFISEEAERTLKGTLWRVSYLGDKASDNTLINKNNGILTQLSAGAGTKINITQQDPTGEELYKYFEEAYLTAMDTPWGAEEDLVWKMTYATASRFVAFLNTKADLSLYNCDCLNPDNIVTGRRFNVQGLRIFGIPVEVHREIDNSLKAVSNTKKHHAILTRKSNLAIGTNTADKLEMFDMFFDKKDRKIYIDLMMNIGASVLLDEYVYLHQ